jgi:hypothetical protein
VAARVRVTYGLKADISSPTFQQMPQPSPLQARVYQLLASYPVSIIEFFAMHLLISILLSKTIWNFGLECLSEVSPDQFRL